MRGKIPDIDRISYHMIRNLNFGTKQRLIHLYNLIFNNFIPHFYKISTISPILKHKSDKTLLVRINNKFSNIYPYPNYTYSITSAIKSLMLSKIRYGIYLYGWSPKSYFTKSKTIINSAIRISLDAFRTTQIYNMLFEANIELLETIIHPWSTVRTKIIHNLSNNTDIRIQSTLSRIANFARENNLPLNPLLLQMPPSRPGYYKVKV